MEQTLVDALLGGSPYAIVVALAIAYVRKDRAHIAEAQARVEDAQGITGTLMTLMKENNATTQGLTATLAAQANVINSLNESVKELRDTLERLRERRGGE